MRRFEDSVRELQHVSRIIYGCTKDPWWKVRVEWCDRMLKIERERKIEA